MHTPDIWAPWSLSDGQTARVTLGPLTLWIRRSKDEWHLAEERSFRDNGEEPNGSALEVGAEKPADGPPWCRWIGERHSDAIRLVPCMPRRPVVVRPEDPIFIPPERKARFYVNIPICIGVEVGSKLTRLKEVSTLELSKTWFGDPVEGEACYCMLTTARRELQQLYVRPHRAVCVVNVVNRADEQLGFERLCLRVDSLALFMAGGRLFTNQVHVVFKGAGELSKVTFSNTPPAEFGAAERIAAERNPATGGLLTRSFSLLHLLPNH